MAIKKRSKLKAKVAAKAKAVRSAVLKARPLARVLDQSKGVQGKVKTAGINLGRVNKVLKEETKTGAPAAAMVEALEKSADVEEKVQEAADELVGAGQSGRLLRRHAVAWRRRVGR